MQKIGYCLWCGSEITVAGYDCRNGTIEWEHCRNYPCTGAIKTVISDAQGFVIFPYFLRGWYIYSTNRIREKGRLA